MKNAMNPTNTIEMQTVYRALTGLENAQGARVEQGEILPPDFVPDAQLEIWSDNGDIVVVFDDVREEENA